MPESKKNKDDPKLREFLEGVRRRCPDNIPVLEALGDLYTRMSLLDEGLHIDRILTEQFPDNETYWYNLACSLSLLGRPEEAISALRHAAELGYDDVAWMMEDDDLASLRKSPEFAAIVVSIKTNKSA